MSAVRLGAFVHLGHWDNAGIGALGHWGIGSLARLRIGVRVRVNVEG